MWMHSRLSSRELTQPKHRVIRQLAGPPTNYATPPALILLQLSGDSLLYVNTIYHTQGRNWRTQNGELPPCQAKCKNRFPTYISVLAFFWFSVGCCFCVFFGLFSGGLGFSIYIRIHHNFSSFFWVLASGPRTVVSEPLLFKFSTMA